MNSGHQFKVLDLFSGIGGFSLGLERTGYFNTVAFCEIDAAARRVLNKRWPHVPIYEDIRELTADRLSAVGIAVDVICGGFPCQDISQAGLRGGIVSERSGLWAEYFRLIGELRPRYAIIENVTALRNQGLALVLQNLNEIGYCAEFHCIPACALGHSHQRDRIWVVAYPDTNTRHSPTEGLVSRQEHPEESERGQSATEARDSGEVMADTISEGPQGWISRRQDAERESISRYLRHSLSSIPGRWVALPGEPQYPHEPDRTAPTKPRVGRASNGLSTRMDRIKQLGNAVVPQIPELLGNAIIEREKNEVSRSISSSTCIDSLR
jgi:DNA (cytosine-5)-methyltransferase 1